MFTNVSLKLFVMTKKVREVFAPAERIQITGLKLEGPNSGRLSFDVLDEDNEVVGSGTAACFDLDKVELDDDNILVGECRLSNSGEYINPRRTYDKSGLGVEMVAKKTTLKRK